jgi:hypothetical protein
MTQVKREVKKGCMTEQQGGDSAAPLLYLIMAGVIAYAAIFLVLMVGVILTICLTAGAGYLGYRTALDSQLWENRRLVKDRRLESARKAELTYYEKRGKGWMKQVVDNYYDDKERDLYARETSKVDTAVNTIRKLKESLK